LQDLVDHDYLTGLYNMRSMYNKIDYELKRAKRLKSKIACLMMDMDYFKSVNDGHDHLFGSYVLKSVGELIISTIRETDFAARYGGDEYLIVLTDANDEGSMILSERMREKIGKHVFKEGKDETQLTVSIGVAVSSADDAELDARTLVRRADSALYRAKDSGRDQVTMFLEKDLVNVKPVKEETR